MDKSLSKGAEKRLTYVQSAGNDILIQYTPGTKVFYVHPTESWKLGEVTGTNAKNVTVTDSVSSTEHVVKNSDVHPVVDSFVLQETDNLLNLNELHEATLLHNIHKRFTKDDIYTYTGPIVIAVNPLHKMPQLYDEEKIKQYRTHKHEELPPHIFAVADSAYQSMLSTQTNQSILISGESGAGKTETTKLLMKYLAAVSGKNLSTGDIQHQIMEANPILEAFGNAKTLRNNNSSRFGRWISIQFDGKGCLTGAVITNYLLEKSRIVYQAKGERNYHIFYQLLAGAKSSGLAEKFKLKDVNSFNYLNQSECTAIDGVDDAADFEALKNAFTVLDILEGDQIAIFKALAAILHLGNVNFVLDEKNENWNGSVVENKDVLKFVASLLGVDCKELEHALVTRMNFIRGEYFEVPLDLQQARDARDSVAKAIYNEIFGWLVQRINEKMADYSSERFIGLLDIFGFESFAVNSFEQFCINLANEKLQQHYNRHTFKWEQEACFKEEIDYTKIDFVDNQLCLDLIEKKLGILALLDEESNFPKATDESFLAKLIQHHSDHPYFSKTPKSTSAFSIKHYAAEVSYESVNFLEKNKDTLKDDLVKLLSTSTDPFIKNILSGEVHKERQKMKKLTVSGAFKWQLDQLMEALEKTSPHWIRCIKPNNDKQARMFDGPAVLHQLRCAGVLETVRIRKSGFPIRIPFEDFLKRFKVIHKGKVEGKTTRAMCVAIVNQQKFNSADCQVGLTRVFLKQEQFDTMEKLRGDKLNQPATIIQRNVRGWLTRLRLKRLRAAKRVQKVWRGYFYSTRYQRTKSAALLLQTIWRRLECSLQYRVKKNQSRKENGLSVVEPKKSFTTDIPVDVPFRDNPLLSLLVPLFGLESGVSMQKLESLEQGLLSALERVRDAKDSLTSKSRAPPQQVRRVPIGKPVLKQAPTSKPAPSSSPSTAPLKPSPAPSSSLKSSPFPSPSSPPPTHATSPPQTHPTSPPPVPASGAKKLIAKLPAQGQKPVVAQISAPQPAAAPAATISGPPPAPPPPPPAATAPPGAKLKTVAKLPAQIQKPAAQTSAPQAAASAIPPPPPPPPPATTAPPVLKPKPLAKSSAVLSKAKPAALKPEPAPEPKQAPTITKTEKEPKADKRPIAKSTTPPPVVAVAIPVTAPSHPPGGFATRSRPPPARSKKNRNAKPYNPPPGSFWTDDSPPPSSSPPPVAASASPPPQAISGSIPLPPPMPSPKKLSASAKSLKPSAPTPTTNPSSAFPVLKPVAKKPATPKSPPFGKNAILRMKP